jgi:hypothetical protein
MLRSISTTLCLDEDDEAEVQRLRLRLPTSVWFFYDFTHVRGPGLKESSQDE